MTPRACTPTTTFLTRQRSSPVASDGQAPAAADAGSGSSLRRLSRAASGLFSKKPQRYEEADLSDDGSGNYPRQIAV